MLQILVGFFSGIISGMGIGCGAILIPALIFLEGTPQHVAQGINLIYFLPTAVVSLIVHIKNKNVELKTAAVIAASGIIGALGGAWLATGISGGLLRKMFGVFLFLIGVFEVVKGIKIFKSKKKIK